MPGLRIGGVRRFLAPGLSAVLWLARRLERQRSNVSASRRPHEGRWALLV